MVIRCVLRQTAPRLPGIRCLSQSARPRGDPLRILFCGSDSFACESLERLHREHRENGQLIRSLDVMVLPPKRTGREQKPTEVPVKLLADGLGLPIHQRPTFRDWTLPEGINLIVAVSFGLFVPPRILRAAKYGGLNVHPSFLPDLRGPAPVHHALLNGYTHTGVSLQTLDEKAFDHGKVLSQTPAPGISIPAKISLGEMTALLAKEGSELLVEGLRNGVHIPPLQDRGWYATRLTKDEGALRHAPKLFKADAQIGWGAAASNYHWTSQDFERRLQVFDSVWTHVIDKNGRPQRVIFGSSQTEFDPQPVASKEKVLRVMETRHNPEGPVQVEKDVLVRKDKKTSSVLMNLGPGQWVRVFRAKVEGKREQDGMTALSPFVREQ